MRGELHKNRGRPKFTPYGKVPKERKTYPQIWPKYNQAKTQEKYLFLTLLDELLEEVFPEEEKTKQIGRPSLPLKQMIFASCVREYSCYSSRKTISELKIAKDLKLLTKVPHFNSICNFLQNEDLYPKLQKLIIISSLPLAKVETHIAVDSTGFSLCAYDRWIQYKWGEKKGKTRGWVKAHIACGAKTQIICSAQITNKDAGDSPVFGNLFAGFRRYFEAKEVSADRAYSSKINLKMALEKDIVPYIPFRSNATADDGSHRQNSAWIQMYYYFKNNEEEFLRHYHQRSKIETTFSMVKKRLGSNLKSKTLISQKNELLCRFLVHNICVLVQEIFELGIDVDFYKASKEVAQKEEE